jgi:endonuclease/exonuclease/phosphatase family metal-dependent hydrolase
MPDLKIVTFNLLNKPSRWEERRQLVAEQLAELEPDVIALQEVTLPDNRAQWLADRLGGYEVHLSPLTGRYSDKQANAILSRLPIRQRWTLDLRRQWRVAQGARIDAGGREVLVANGHLYWHVVDHHQQVLQVKRMLDWLDSLPPGLPTVVCGDFNGTPDYRSVRMMKRRFTSAHAARHGREPAYTCPTPLRYRFSPVRNTLSRLGNLARSGSLDLWRGTLDYIFVDARVRVMDCEVVLDRAAPHDRTIYPSDHVGLYARLAV